MSEQQTQQADDPGGPGWREVTTGGVTQDGDMVRCDDNFPLGRWVLAEPGETVTDDDVVRRRIEPQQPSDSEPETMEDLRRRLNAAVRQNVELAELLANEQNKKGAYERIAKASVERARDAESLVAEADRGGQQVNAELQQLREAKERNEKLVRQLELTQQENGELQGLVSQAERSGEQVNAELQQLREQVQMLTQERDRLQSWLQQHHTTGQQSAIKKLERWLKPVLKVVADHPDDTSILAVSVLEFLPQIASRLIEE